MLGEFGTLFGSIALALISVAIVSVIVSPNAKTSDVIQAAATGFAQDLQAATSPVSGGGSSLGGFNPSSFNNGLHL